MSRTGGGRSEGSRARSSRARSVALLMPACALLLLTGCWIQHSPTGDGSDDNGATFRQQVREMLWASAEAWNRGDLDAFMADYERAPSTTYIGGPGLVRGFDAIRERYAPLFGAGAERDSLRFELLETRLLGQRHGLAVIRYVLFRPAADTASSPADTADTSPQEATVDAERPVTSTGLVTLVLVRVEGDWHIIHDQSAADPAPSEPLAEPPSEAAEEETGAARLADDGPGS